jgi:deoxyribose-phosphate aldolase
MESQVKLDSIVSKIDHTLLKPDATESQIHVLVEEALKYHFFSVCINPTYVSLCKKLLTDSKVAICTVIGFPLGASSTNTKVFETKEAIKDGADEIDMVINIGAMKSKNYDFVLNDIKSVVEAAEGKIVKVIIETSLLNEEEKIKACQLSTEAKAHFVKTSTGFNGGGATLEDVKLMKAHIDSNMKVKASGGIRDVESAKKMISVGAERLGTSAGVLIANHLSSNDFY